MRVRENFLVFGAPAIGRSEMREVVLTLRSGWLGTGPRTKAFETAFAAYKDMPKAVALNSATAGLHLACLALDLQPGDEIITTAMTFCATVNAIIHSGATPVLADIDPLTWNIDPQSIEQHITERTRAILVVHLSGRPCDMDAILDIAKRHRLRVIEDCAHAVETEYHGRKAGTLGEMGVFSFYATKNVVTGEGGMLIGHDSEQVDRIRRLSLHGMSGDAWKRFSADGYKHYLVEEAGYKYNMTDMQAALGLHQLARVEANWRRRREMWNQYQHALIGKPFVLPALMEAGTRHALHLFQILIDPQRTGFTRDAFLEAMTARKIGVGVHYLAIPEHPYYQRRFGWRAEDYPHATRIGRQTVSLPLSVKMSDSDQLDVLAAVDDILAQGARHERIKAAA